jgi:hypothetical protein
MSKRAGDTGLAMVLLLLLLMLFLENLRLVWPAIVLLVITILWPMAFHPLARIWFIISKGLGTLGSMLVLSLLYFTLVYPIGKLRQLMGADSMKLLRWKKNDGSIFHERNTTYQRSDLEKPY